MRPLECQDALGMESGLISDDKLSASSEYKADQAANRGRLHIQYSGGKTGGWVAVTNDVNQWLQVDLGSQYTKVTRVATQGRSDYPHWVIKHKLQYSSNGMDFQNYREQGQNVDKVLTLYACPFVSQFPRYLNCQSERMVLEQNG